MNTPWCPWDTSVRSGCAQTQQIHLQLVSIVSFCLIITPLKGK